MSLFVIDRSTKIATAVQLPAKESHRDGDDMAYINTPKQGP